MGGVWAQYENVSLVATLGKGGTTLSKVPRANPPDETPGCARSNIVEVSQNVAASSDGTISPVGCRASVPEIAEIGTDTFGKKPE